LQTFLLAIAGVAAFAIGLLAVLARNSYAETDHQDL
jgi:uncharacterized protein involved in exopolysaccharide biosynthesis